MLKIGSTAALLLALAGVPALAQNAQAPGAQGPAAQAARTISMAEAIKAAQGRLPGGVLEAEIESRGGREVYEIEIVSTGKIHEVQVDAQSGQIIATEEKVMSTRFKQWFAEGRLDAAERAPDVLVRALPELERQMGGTVTEVGLERENDRLTYEVELQTAQGGRETHIDVATGQNVARNR
jgi:uncharacterized membrane protein YkoI